MTEVKRWKANEGFLLTVNSLWLKNNLFFGVKSWKVRKAGMLFILTLAMKTE